MVSLAPTEKWWLLEPPGRCLVPQRLPIIPRRFRHGKQKINMQEEIQFVCAQLPSGKKESENSSGCPLKIQKKRIEFLKRQEAVAWEKQREKHVLCHLITQMTKKNRTFLFILD
ncbi:PCNA-associated factor isoform X1 [Vicugna pacos]|uniref:PCNA-associated factor isoform X1 n=1 Tax=Vicugna pacos TaxID=30538 RepID=A0ABM5DBT4_VICPA